MSGDLIYLWQRRRATVLVVSVPLCEGQPVAMCVCGGLLDYQAGTWCHVEACVECWPPAGRRCPNRLGHTACHDPEPAGCEHPTCRNPAMIEAVCAGGGAPRTCCGCCWELADLRDGKSLWPR